MIEDVMMIPPALLEAHPYLDEDPMLDEASEDWLLLVDDIAEHGIEHPLTVAVKADAEEDDYLEIDEGRTYILGDGRHRLKAAIAAGLTRVPCKVVSESRLLEFILKSESVRKFRTKTAQAWRAAAFCNDLIEESKKARAANARGGDSYKCTECTYRDLASVARQIGVSVDMLKKARSARFQVQALADRPAREGSGTIRDQVNRMIYEEGAGINAISALVKAVKGDEAGKLHSLTDEQKWKKLGQYVAKGWEKSVIHFERWDQFPDEQKRVVYAKVPELAASLPADVRAMMLAKLLELDRKERGE